MDPERVDPMTGFLKFLESLSSGKTSEPLERVKLHDGTITVDTCLASDTGKYETAVRHRGEKMIIVEQYPDEESAKVGHKKWVNILTEYPDYPLKDIDLWNLGEDKDDRI